MHYTQRTPPFAPPPAMRPRAIPLPSQVDGEVELHPFFASGRIPFDFNSHPDAPTLPATLHDTATYPPLRSLAIVTRIPGWNVLVVHSSAGRRHVVVDDVLRGIETLVEKSLPSYKPQFVELVKNGDCGDTWELQAF